MHFPPGSEWQHCLFPTPFGPCSPPCFHHVRRADRIDRLLTVDGRCYRKRSERLGRHRWVVERTLSWLACFRRPTIRYERRADIHLAFLTLAWAVIGFRSLPRFW